MTDSGSGLRWPLPRLPYRKHNAVRTPTEPSVRTQLEDLMNHLADEGTARLHAQEAARADACDGEPEPAPLPPGVLGYGVGVFPGNADTCSGLTHTGLMTAESAQREAAQYAIAARTDPVNARHAECGYRPVEIRAVSRG